MNKPTTPFTPMTEGQAMLQKIVDGWIRQSVQNGKTEG